MWNQALRLLHLRLPERTATPCERRPCADLRQNYQTQLLWARAASKSSREFEPDPVLFLVRNRERRTIEPHKPQTPIPRAGRRSLGKRSHASLPKRLEWLRPEPRPRTGDRRLVRVARHQLRLYPAKSLHQAAQHFPSRNRPEEPHRNHVVNHYRRRQGTLAHAPPPRAPQRLPGRPRRIFPDNHPDAQVVG